VGGTASAFELVGRHRLIRAQAAQAKPNFRLGSLYMTIVDDCAVLLSQLPEIYRCPCRGSFYHLTRETVEKRRQLRALLRQSRMLIQQIE
jgi:hypothetical protein